MHSRIFSSFFTDIKTAIVIVLLFLIIRGIAADRRDRGILPSRLHLARSDPITGKVTDWRALRAATSLPYHQEAQ
jgi:hypothetical protein